MITRRLPTAVLIGLALAASLWFGVIPGVTWFFAERQHHVRFDPKIVDLVGLLLNIGLLGLLAAVAGLRRQAQRRAGEDLS